MDFDELGTRDWTGLDETSSLVQLQSQIGSEESTRQMSEWSRMGLHMTLAWHGMARHGAWALAACGVRRAAFVR